MLSSRRIFLGALMALMVFAQSSAVLARNVVSYTPAVLQEAADAGDAYLLDFSATWCGTCQAQERVLDALQSESARYQDIKILRVDWDQHRRGPLVQALAIPRRSVLVLMRGETELGRVVAQTGKTAIASLLDLAQ